MGSSGALLSFPVMRTLFSVIDRLAFHRGGLCCISTVELPHSQLMEGGIDYSGKVVGGIKIHTDNLL